MSIEPSLLVTSATRPQIEDLRDSTSQFAKDILLLGNVP